MASRAKSHAAIVQAPLMPNYSEIAHVIRLVDKEPIQKVRQLINSMKSQQGTPQNPVDWSHPDNWIDERLSGECAVLARKIWLGSDRSFNPRYLYGSYLFINRLKLLDKINGIYKLGDRGSKFLAGDEALLRELDAIEGFPKLLQLVAERSPCRSGDILPPWSDYLKSVSLFTTIVTFKDTLRRRLLNATERGLVAREGTTYSITDAGLRWLRGFQAFTPAIPSPDPATSTRRMSVAEAAHAYNEEQLVELRGRLMKLEPAQFEYFVRELLDAMEYEDVQVTKLSGDKGVDVVAKVQFGITEIVEVVQVKRTENTITRPVVDALRGALPYHKAIRGTIISLGDFAKGAKEGALYVGAAPITLIDGRRLLELCVKHEVGVKRRPVEIYEVNVEFFDEQFAAKISEDIEVVMDVTEE